MKPSPATVRLPVIDLLRVVAIFFVMLIHSSQADESFGLYFLKSYLAAGAVPVFFLLSGYLGARKIMSSPNYGTYVKEKWGSLIIPYLFWSILIIIAVLSLNSTSLGEVLRGSGNYFGLEPTFASISSALFGLGRMPIVYQFWFLRDLIVVSLLGYFIFKHLPDVRLLGFLFLIIPLPIFPSMGYFLLGCQIHRLRSESFSPGMKEAAIYCVTWTAMGVALYYLRHSPPPGLAISLGSAAFLYFVAYLLGASALGRRLALLGPATFFVYAAHEPTQTILFKVWQVMGLPGGNSLLFFLFSFLCSFSSAALSHTLL